MQGSKIKSDIPQVTNLANLDVLCTTNGPMEDLLINIGARRLAEQNRPVQVRRGRPRIYDTDRNTRRRKAYRVAQARAHLSLLREDEQDLLNGIQVDAQALCEGT